ncbi:MAG: YihY/virulence factor BrkB family protein [Clostridia bacterium]|nr:YihY/virulence factor BrkB family protein [Oscillospiraceae bacterium]MBQ2750473.1 YihY/virulence factor BrkB family protein [Clostridia bacterium]MBR6763100.1 YihY/virulence factor BrkB family protein [Clostridia bacterium]
MNISRRLFKILYQTFTSEHVGRAGAAASYYALFMIFPLIISVSALTSTFHYTDAILRKLQALLPNQIRESIISYFEYVSGAGNTRFFLFGFVMFLYSCYRLVDYIQFNLSEIYSPGHITPFFPRLCRSLFTTLILVLLIPILFLTIFLTKNIISIVWDSFALPLEGMMIWYILRVPLAVSCMLLLVILFYRFATRHVLSFRDVLPGAVIAFLLWLITTLSFSFYLNHIGDYSVLYGAMGTVIALMLWCYFTMYSLFFGARINVEIRNTQ